MSKKNTETTGNSESTLSDLLDFLSKFKDKYSPGILRLHSDGSGQVYNAGGGGFAHKEATFKSIQELQRIMEES